MRLVGLVIGPWRQQRPNMDPDEFLSRLIDRASSRYGVKITRSQLEDLVAEYLVPPATKAGGNGWQRDCLSYRRALEVCRIRSKAPKGRRLLAREIRIQQWLSHRPFPETVIRTDFCEEFRREKRGLFRSLRNSLPIGDTLLGEKRLTTLERQMGEASPQILPVGFKYDRRELGALLALLDSGDTEEKKLGGVVIAPDEAISAITQRWGLSSFLESRVPDFRQIALSVLSGLLGSPEEMEAAGETVLRTATQEQYETARDLVRCLPWMIANIPEIAAAFSDGPSGLYTTLATPCTAIAKAANEQRWRFAIFILLLVSVVKVHDQPIGYFVREILPSIQKIIGKCRSDPPRVDNIDLDNPWNVMVLFLPDVKLPQGIIRHRFRAARHLWNSGLRDLRRKYREAASRTDTRAKKCGGS